MKELHQKFGISGSTLKMIAIFTMLIDHLGATVIRKISGHTLVIFDPTLKKIWAQIYSCSRSLGRIAFPIFCFLIVEGYLHTRNPRKYAARLFLFSLISEVPFDIALKGSWYFPQKQNVYFTLLIGLLVLIAIDFLTCSFTRYQLLAVLPIAAGMFLTAKLNTDYNFKGIFLISALYMVNQNRVLQCAAGMSAVAWELPAPAAFLPIALYNGTRGKQMKYFFYWFYPVHLMILYFIKTYIIP